MEAHKVAIAAIGLFTFAVVYIIAFVSMEKLVAAITPVLLILVSLELVVLFVPWERVSSLKVGEVALTLEKTEVKGALAVFINEKENQEIKNVLSSYSQKFLDSVKGCNILWIDDKQPRLVGQKRLLRSLGANITSATSSEDALKALLEVNDFDLIISNVNRSKISQSPDNAGVNFIFHLKVQSGDIFETAKNLPVIFFSALTSSETSSALQLAIKDFPLLKDLPIPFTCSNTEDLLRLVFLELTKSRSNPKGFISYKAADWRGREELQKTYDEFFEKLPFARTISK